MPAIPAIIAAGATVGGAVIGAHGNTEAAKTQAASDKEALAQAKQIYEQQRADQGPYRESGYGAMDALNFGLGLPAVSRANAAAATPPAATPSAPGPLSAVQALAENGINTAPRATSENGAFYLPGHGGVLKSSAVANSGLQKVRNPSGMVYLVPADKVQEAVANGGKVV